MKRFISLQTLSLGLTISLTACVSPYQGFNNSSKKPLGYQEVLLTDTDKAGRYHLSYHGDGSREQNYQHWQQRASELCPSGYKVIRHETDTFYGSLKSPVNGMMVTLGTQQPIDRGIIQCH